MEFERGYCNVLAMNLAPWLLYAVDHKHILMFDQIAQCLQRLHNNYVRGRGFEPHLR